MQLLPAGIALLFEVSYEPALFVGMVILDYTTGEPVAVTGLEGQFGSVLPMFPDEVGSSLYVAEFMPLLDHVYVLKKNVYTDGTYETVDDSGDYSQGSESFIAQNTSVQVLVQNMKLIVGCEEQPRQRPVIIAQTSDATVLLSFFDEWEHPVDITSASIISLSMLEADNETVLTKAIGTGVELVEGRINQALVTLLAADIATLANGNNDAVVKLTLSGVNTVVNAYAAVNVQPSPLVFP